MRRIAIFLLVGACGDRAGPPDVVAVSPPEPPAVVASPTFVEDARWPVLAVPVAFTADGQRWVGGQDQELVVRDGDRVLQRLPIATMPGDALFALPDGGWVAGDRIVAADGKVRFSGHDIGQRYGMFGSAKAIAVSRDGRLAIVAGADSPSTCGRDCPPGSSRGALLRINTSEGAYFERVLVDHEQRRDFRVAASTQWVAALEGATLSVWQAGGDDPPLTVEIEGRAAFDRMTAVGDRWLLLGRILDPEHHEVVVLDRDDRFARAAAWTVQGSIQALAVRPGADEVAIGTSWYRARTRVEVDEKRMELRALDGTIRARVDLDAIPLSLAWSPAGDALLVAASGREPGTDAVIRFTMR